MDDTKVMNLYLKVPRRMRSMSQIILLSFQIGVVKSFDYAFYISSTMLFLKNRNVVGM